MKKYLSIVLAVVMVAALSVSAFASTCLPDDDENIFYDVPGCHAAPVMDGVVADGEYSEIATKKSQWSIAVSDDENDDLAWALAESAKVYMTWDADYVYYASVFTAPKGFDSAWEDDPASMWYSGAIQMTFTDLASKEDDTQNRLEYGIGTTAAGTKITTVWANAEGFEYDPEAIKDNFAIGKNGTTITFETRTPYSVFADVKGAEGTKIAGNVVYSIGEDQDYIHAQLAAGCTGEGGKNQIHDAVFTFVAAPEIIPEVPGYATAAEAAAGKNVITGYTFVSGSEGYNNEGPENLFDGDTATKFCTGTFPCEAVAQLDGIYSINGFAMATANDNADYNGRSPQSWTISVSADGANWTTLASGDDSFFAETNFTYYVGDAAAAGVNYVKFSNDGTASGTFQVSELTLFGDKTGDVAAPAAAEAAPAPAAEAAPAAAPVAAAAPAAAAPAAQTGDSSALIVLAAVAALGTAVVVAKKH